MWVSFQPRLVSGPEEALAAATNRLNLPLESIIETPLPFPPAPAQAVGSASIVRFRHSEIEIKCLLSHAALLVLNEAWFPGWHAVFGGQRIESQPVNYWMRGFALPAGEHHVKLLFQPRRQTLALWLTTGSLAACWGLLSSRRRLSCRAGTSARTGLENQGKS